MAVARKLRKGIIYVESCIFGNGCYGLPDGWPYRLGGS